MKVKMKVKLIDPDAKPEVWIHPEDPGFVVEYKAVCEPALTTDEYKYAKRKIDKGVVSVTNGGKAVIEPKTGWSSTIPPAIQTVLFIEISRISNLSPEEKQDLPSQPGSASTGKNTTAKDAGGKDGSA